MSDRDRFQALMLEHLYGLLDADEARELEAFLGTPDGTDLRVQAEGWKDKLAGAYVMGTPVVALCGKVWVPSRDPSRFPVCPECKELYEMGPEGRKRFWRDRGGDGGSGGTGGE